MILAALDTSVENGDMDVPGFKLHPRKGRLKGRWSVSVSDNWRITFEFREGNAYVLDSALKWHCGFPGRSGGRLRAGLQCRTLTIFGRQNDTSGSIGCSKLNLHLNEGTPCSGGRRTADRLMCTGVPATRNCCGDGVLQNAGGMGRSAATTLKPASQVWTENG